MLQKSSDKTTKNWSNKAFFIAPCFSHKFDLFNNILYPTSIDTSSQTKNLWLCASQKTHTFFNQNKLKEESVIVISLMTKPNTS